MPDFESILQKQLQHVDQTDPDARAQAYQRVRDVLNRTLSTPSDRQLLLDNLYELEDAIAKTERAFAEQKPDSGRWGWFSRLIDRLNHVWAVTEKVGKAAAVLSAIVAIAGVAVWFFFSQDQQLPKVQRSAIEQTACKPLSQDQCDYLISAIERTKNRGAIVAANAGDLKPAEEIARRKAQDSRSEKGSAAAVDASILNLALNRLEEQTKRAADGIERVEQSVRNAKLETSTDPRKELQNLGKNWTEEDFKLTMVMCDIRALKLYRDAGMKLKRNLALDRLAYIDMDCLQVYREQFVAFGPELCFSPEFTIVGTANPIAYLRTVYKSADRRRLAEELCGEARLRDTYPELYGGKPKSTSAPDKELSDKIASLTLDEQGQKAELERLKVLFPGAQPGMPTPPQPANQPGPNRDNRALSAQEVLDGLVGKSLNHAGMLDITFSPNGTFASGDGRVGRNGNYQIQRDGRICWKDSSGFDGCFQYFRENGVLKVRRNDSKSRDLIGAVRVSSR